MLLESAALPTCQRRAGREDQMAPVRIVVSKHADKRMRERMGLKRSAVQRTVEKAWRDGLPIRDVNGQERGDNSDRNRWWAGFVFVFSQHGDALVCVTVVRESAEGGEPALLAYREEGQRLREAIGRRERYRNERMRRSARRHKKKGGR